MTEPGIMPEEYRALSELESRDRILAHKDKMGADLVILAHHYQRQEIVDLADFLGDSLKLSREASRQDARYIVFCGVHFMAESAAILARPEQAVFIPDVRAGCPLADLADSYIVGKAWQDIAGVAGEDGVVPITYINSDSELKAFCGERGGATCTSSSAAEMMKWAFGQAERVLFFPDENLGRNSGKKLGIKDAIVWDPGLEQGGASEEAIKKSRLILWRGYCHVHTFFRKEHVEKMRAEHPGALVVVHPECESGVVEASDASGSTEQIIQYVRQAPEGSTVVVGTEINMVERLARECAPGKKVLPLARSMCPNMYKINLQKLLWVLDGIAAGEDRWVNRVEVPGRTREPALVALRRMLEIG